MYKNGVLHMQRARNHLEAALELIEENFVGLAAYVGEYNFKLAKVTDEIRHIHHINIQHTIDLFTSPLSL